MKLTIRPQPLGTLMLQAANRPQVRLNLSSPQVRVQGGGIVGPRGDTGPRAEELILVAATAIGGHRAVGPDGNYADAQTAPEVAGISRGAGSTGQALTIQADGSIAEAGWSWTLGQPVWLGSNGLLTQTPPTEGYCVQVGIALAATRMLIRITSPVQLV